MSLVKTTELFFTTNLVNNSDSQDTHTLELPVKLIEHSGHAYAQINDYPIYLCEDTLGYLTDMLEQHQRRIDTK